MRSKKAQSFVELGTGMIVLLPLVLGAIDIAFIGVGASINDAVCRDAARAASAGTPAQKVKGTRKLGAATEPFKRALKVLKTQAPANASVSISDNMDIEEKLEEDAPPEEVGGSVVGEISVRTTCSVVPPFQLQMFSGPVTLSAVHVLPYTYAVAPKLPKEEP